MKNDNDLASGTGTMSLTHALQIKIQHIPLKRAFDIAFSIFTLILSFPLFLLIAMAVRFTSKQNVIYAHERVGRGGIPFRCYKFRTMYADADKRLQEILKNDPERRQEWNSTHKLKEDPRITPIGAFLRRTSLDELPQFWNVLKGDLSIVGPRPVVYEELLKHFGTKAHKILSIRPGLTGIWQVSGRSNTSYQERIKFDEQYVDNRSLLMDVKLIAKTIPSIIASRGAY